MIFSEAINRAIRFAANAHEGQYRKGGRVPYVSHPVMVGMLLQRSGFDGDTVVAGILHDVVEDAGVTLDEIEAGFGAPVADIVRQVSDPPGLPFKERKLHQAAAVRNASVPVKAVKAADILHNLYSTLESLRKGEDIWRYFDKNKEGAVWGYRELLKALGNGWSHPLLDEIGRFTGELERL